MFDSVKSCWQGRSITQFNTTKLLKTTNHKPCLAKIPASTQSCVHKKNRKFRLKLKNMKFTLTEPISGQWPCQLEGLYGDTNEHFYFRQRGDQASLRIYDKPLGESLDKNIIPLELAKYTIAVEPLNCDAEYKEEEVMATILALLFMHEQAPLKDPAENKPQLTLCQKIEPNLQI